MKLFERNRKPVAFLAYPIKDMEKRTTDLSSWGTLSGWKAHLKNKKVLWLNSQRTNNQLSWFHLSLFVFRNTNLMKSITSPVNEWSRTFLLRVQKVNSQMWFAVSLRLFHQPKTLFTKGNSYSSVLCFSILYHQKKYLSTLILKKIFFFQKVSAEKGQMYGKSCKM